jgi:ATP-dependent DNA helicase UvrD/PcrA
MGAHVGRLRQDDPVTLISARLGPDDVLDRLDAEQREAAQAVRGPVAILAGAGTGKTRTITHRIAYAVHAGMWQPQQVLAVTFTTRAAGEMRTRLADLGVPGVQARTFHSAALRQARFFWPQVYDRDLPQIIESKLGLVGQAAGACRMSLDLAGRRDVASEIEWAKVSNVSVEDYPQLAERAGRDVSGIEPEQVARLFGAYEQARRDADRIDLEDVLLCAAGLLAGDARTAARIRSQYRHLVVDEYQDVSPLQQALLDLWLGDNRDLCVVGDPTQTIYSFAGARAEFLREFPKRYPGAQVLALHRDYRSTPQVVATANALMERADAVSRRAHVRLSSEREPGPAVVYREYADEVAEAAGVAAAVRALVSAGVSPGEVAVLYRINAQSEPVEQALTDAGMPYQVRGGERFFERPEVREAMAMLRGAAVAEAAELAAAGVDDGAGDPATRPAPLEQAVAGALSAVGYTSEPPAGTGRTRERWESLSALVALAVEQEQAGLSTLRSFVDVLVQRSEAQHAPGLNGVSLSTLHAAKGLEWKQVFLIGLHDQMLPSSQARTDQAIAEERRLLYVGITRAADGLTMSWGLSRSPGGAGRRRPSRFLDGLRPAGSSVHDRDRPDARGARRGPSATVARCRVCGSGLTDATARRLGRCTTCPSSYDEGLLEQLRAWRLDRARELGQPAFCVFTDATLIALAEARPVDRRTLLAIPGIGAGKADKFGDEVVRLCAR